MELSTQLLTTLSQVQLNQTVAHIETLRAHASKRQIFRLHYENSETKIGILNPDIQENITFVSFSKSFKLAGLPVPEVFAFDKAYAYIQTDLGNQTLMDVIKSPDTKHYADHLQHLYEQALCHLVQFQVQGLEAIDTNHCFEGSLFDTTAVARDFQYFCSQYVERIGIHDKTYSTHQDIAPLLDVCSDYERGFFMHRDFQSRNIMIQNDQLYFIDFQSGREGPIYYDLVSLLFQSQAKLPVALREHLITHYLDLLSQSRINIPRNFEEKLTVFALVRILQNLGAYGKLGLGEDKTYFKHSIPLALKNLEYILDHWPKCLPAGPLKSLLRSTIEHGCPPL